MLHELIDFLEAALVKEQKDPFARREFALRVLAGAPFLAAAGFASSCRRRSSSIFCSRVMSEPKGHYSGELLRWARAGKRDTFGKGRRLQMTRLQIMQC